MKIKLPNFKPAKTIFSLRYLYIVAFLLLIGAIAILGNFLYKNFYQTITQSEEIILLKKEVAPDIINIDKVERVLQLLTTKTAPELTINFDNIKNPFSTTPQPISPVLGQPPVNLESQNNQQATTTE